MKDYDLILRRLNTARFQTALMRDNLSARDNPGVMRKIRSLLKSIDGAIRNAERHRRTAAARELTHGRIWGGS